MLEDLSPTGDPDDLDGLPWLVPFAQDVRFASRGPAPVPSPQLASLFEGAVPRLGFSTDKGDLLVTAASNVHGPATPQVAGLPNWRKESPMPLAFLSTLIGKIVGAGTAAKAAIATIAAFATMTVAGAAAGVLPGPIQGTVGGAINAISPLNVPTGDPAETVATATDIVNNVLSSVPTSVPVVPPSIPLSAETNVQTPVGPASANAGANLVVPPIPQVSIPNIPLPSIPDVTPILNNLPVQLPACVKNLIPTSGAMPNPTALLAQIPGCIQTVLATANLPVNVSACVASVLGTVTGVLNPGAIGSLPKLDVSACVPLDVTTCTANALAATGVTKMPFVGDMLKSVFGSFGVGGSGTPGSGFNFFGNFNFNIPGLNAIPAGCVPIDVSKCLTSLTGSLGSLPTNDGVPKVDLSACMPTGLTSGIPGVGGGIPGLSGIPFFPF
ncbi:MAG: hypothetical protein QOG43_885 [Actinomycetota bacterium]|jgi:hypothetical protein|nr:hypothetical protein [Actinomycetota bacterium]